jgi:predicted nucleotidyltransferase
MILSNDHIKQVITDYFKDKPVKKVWLFGSYARGDADEESDVDVLVDVDYTKKVGIEYFGWYQDLQDILKRKVDVVSEKYINHRLRPHIEKDKSLVYEKS